ncbi:adventurous gliding motility protein AgmC [Myxococcus sp. Y35]|uniref:adventurous gliding motility protein AgmC n=1 Tax=Pseudomyxococcus flavus TaxID=3115648 RepID=UPI003CE6B59C
MKGTWLKAALAGVVVLGAIVAVAGPDTFGIGEGTQGALVVPSGSGAPSTVRVNTYAQITAIATNEQGRPSLTLAAPVQGNASPAPAFASGRLVLVLQATSAASGAIPGANAGQSTIDLGSSDVGRWELARVSTYSTSGGTRTMVLTQPLKHSYAAAATQVILVPEYSSVTVEDGAKIEALPWNGSIGGVVAFFANGAIHLNGTGAISAAGAGFRGGEFRPETLDDEEDEPAEGCSESEGNSPEFQLGMKGEGLSVARYALPARGNANFTIGGGGGVCKQAGGGGGGNAGLGGRGGNAMDREAGQERAVGGLGGVTLAYSPLDHLTLGGGGGSGQGATEEAVTTEAHGGRGGGIVFVRANSLSGGVIDASGASAEESPVSGGGGGAGGSISLRLTTSCLGTELKAEGGKGGDVASVRPENASAAGPGGGGGGGRVFFQSATSSNCPISVAAGTAGLTADGGGESPASHQGATPAPGDNHLPPYVGTVSFMVGGLQTVIEAPSLASFSTPVNTASPLVTGTGMAGATVLIYREHSDSSSVHVLVARTVVGADGQFSVTVPLADGEWTLLAAHEVQGLQGAYSPAQAIWVDTRAPDTRVSTSESSPTPAEGISFTIEGFEANGTPCNGGTNPSCTFECRLVTPSVTDPEFDACLASYPLAESGTYRFEARALDAAGNVDASPAILAFVVDHDAPTVSIRPTDPTPPSARSRFTSAWFGFTSTASDVARFECQLVANPGPSPQPAGWQTCAAFIQYTNLVHGTEYTLSVRAVDHAGNPSETPDTHTWEVDTQAPNTTLTGTLPEVTSQNVSFTFESPASDVARFECSLDSAEYVTCVSPYQPTPAPTDGTHVLQVRAVDEAGNVDPTPASHTWVVDTAPPTVSIVRGPPSPSNQTTAGFDFDSPDSDVERFECQLVANPGPSPQPAGWQRCNASVQYTNLVHGTEYTLSVRAVDHAGNPSETPDTHTWEVDTQAPNTTLTGTLPEVTSQNVSFTFESPASDVARFECSLDSAEYAPCVSPYQPSPAPTDGTHVLQVRAVDEAGNVDPTPASHTWVVDTAPPTVSIVRGPPSPSNQTTAGFDFDSPDSDVERFECQLVANPGPSPQPAGWQRCNASVQYTNLVHGTEYTLSVRAVDHAGNPSETPDTHTWEVDTQAPNTTLTGTLPEVTSQNVSFTFESPASDVARFECSLDSAEYAPCVSPYQPTPAPTDGTHVLQVRAVDEAGNVDPTPAIHTWVVDTIAPDTSISATSPVPPAERYNSQTAVFGFTSSASDVAYFECRLTVTEPESPPTTGAWATCAASHTISGLTDGWTYALEVRAVDRAGNEDATPASHTWLVDVSPPDTAFIPLQVPDALTSLLTATFGFESAAADIERFECSLDGEPFAMCVSPHQRTVDDGDHTMLVRAVDLAGNVDETPAVHVWRVLSGPVVTRITAQPQQLTNDPVARFTFTSNKGNVNFRCTLGEEAEEEDCGTITPDEREVAWVRDVGEGIHTLNVYAVDTDTNAKDDPGEQYTWTVDTTPPESPIITSPSEPYINTMSPRIHGTAPELGTVTVYVGSVNVGSAEVHELGTWEVSGLLLEERQYVVRATLTDKAGNTGSLATSMSRTFTVDITPPETAIVGQPPSRGRERSVVFEFEHVDEANFAAFECSLNGETFQDCPTPHAITVPQDGQHVLRVQARDLAGNRDPSPATYVWEVDSKRPETTIVDKPALFDRSERSQFSFGSDESDVAYQCSLDGSTFAPCDNPISFAGLAEGSHTLQVRAVDSVGNEDDSPVRYDWTVDDTPPEVPTLEFPAAGSIVETRTPQFRGTALGGASEVVILLDGAERGRAPVDGAGQWRFTVTGELPAGEHSVTIYAVDQALNASAQTPLALFQLIPSTEIDSRGGGLSCSLGGQGGGAPLSALGLVAFALLAARRGRRR